MNSASRYWILIKIDAAGKRKIEEILPAKAFFLASFPEFTAQSKVPDALIQRQLLHWMKEAPEEGILAKLKIPQLKALNTTNANDPISDDNRRLLAERCLQCFISGQIDQVCQKLAAQFGNEHGFTSSDLLPFVLDDDGSRQTKQVSTPYKSLFREILESFDPQQSSLATWATRRVRHHKELNAFLLECGVYLVSDWAILNDTTPKQLQRIFSQFHQLTPIEIQQASRLLESYHAVYRAQRLKQRQAGNKRQCLPPTTEQLHQIAKRLLTQTTEMLAPETLITQLQEIASRLREYRVYVRGGSLPTESINVTNPGDFNDGVSSLNLIDNRDDGDDATEFLDFYRQQFLICLDQSLVQLTQERVTQLQRKDSQKAQKFLTALKLFHCQKMSMTDIAPLVNLPAQFNVSRLLQLKSFRADVQQRLLVLLRDRVLDQAKVYTNPERLEALNQQIEEALNEQITTVIQEAATEASTATATNTTSLFAQRLCRQLDIMRTQP